MKQDEIIALAQKASGLKAQLCIWGGEMKQPIKTPPIAALASTPAQPDPAYSAACNLATALFKKHFAHLPDYASGQAVWDLFDSTEGVILQIDNMVAGLVQPPTISPQADSVQEDAALWHWLAEYLVGTRTDLDDEIVASETVNDLRKLVVAAIKQGATQ